ncbi:MAG: hypothetical protein ACE5IJ_02050 [Thermoplasmata archaeon]
MKLACPNCREIFHVEEPKCPSCAEEHQVAALDEEKLLEEVQGAQKESDAFGLGELVGAIDSIVVQVASGKMADTVKELQRMTPLQPSGCYQNDDSLWCVMSSEQPPRFIVKEAKREAKNPFASFNLGEKTKGDTNTRLETFVFEVSDIDKIHEIQRSRAVTFLTDGVFDFGNYRFIQTAPSPLTGNSVGYIQWKGGDHNYAGGRDEEATIDVDEESRDFVLSMDYLDHAATRVRADDRIQAMREWLTLLPYHFQFSIYVKNLNSITNVTRMVGQDFAMVFTTGIKPYQGLSAAFEPTERFIVDYGTRVHHLAWSTSRIKEVVEALKAEGQRFLLDLVGSEEEGLEQTFTVPSEFSMLVMEYIHRYAGFDGFFTRSNVTELTRATGLQ